MIASAEIGKNIKKEPSEEQHVLRTVPFYISVIGNNSEFYTEPYPKPYPSLILGSYFGLIPNLVFGFIPKFLFLLIITIIFDELD